MSRIITLEEAQGRLGEGVVVCLEPLAILKAKGGTPKEPELWVFDPVTGRSSRGDRKFFDVRYFDRGGWGQMGVFEEPMLERVEGVSPIIGHVIIEVAPDGRVQTRPVKGLNGLIIELKPSSVSKGELAPADQVPVGYFEANPQRIGGGLIAVYLNRVSQAIGDDWMSPNDFAKQSTDGRSLSALVKAGLLE